MYCNSDAFYLNFNAVQFKASILLFKIIQYKYKAKPIPKTYFKVRVDEEEFCPSLASLSVTSALVLRKKYGEIICFKLSAISIPSLLSLAVASRSLAQNEKKHSQNMIIYMYILYMLFVHEISTYTAQVIQQDDATFCIKVLF